jgi:tetratricopeptide (TPR) repeat protein
LVRFLLAGVAAGLLLPAESAWKKDFDKAQFAHREGRHSDAERLLRDALRKMESEQPGDPRAAALLNNLGAECHILGRYDDAEQHYRRAVEEWRKMPGSHRQVARSLVNLANLYQLMERPKPARIAYADALLEIRAGTGQESLEYAFALSEAADFHRGLGDLPEALRMAREAAEIAESAVAGEDTVLSERMKVFAAICRSLGSVEEAERAWRDSQDLIV